MPISTISQTISTIPEAGRRGVDVQTTFVTKQEDFQDHLQGTTVSELNALKTQINTTVSGMNDAVTNVNTKASEADADALSASNSAGVATTKAGEASTSASQASTSATKASQWADNNYNVPVEAGKYSAKHWSTVAQNTVAGKVAKVASTDNAVVRFNGTTGEVQNSGVIIDDIIRIHTYGSQFSTYGYNDGTNSFEFVQRAAGKGFLFYVDGGSKYGMTLSSSGNLLVGTTTDNGVDKLQVNGSITSISSSYKYNNLNNACTVDENTIVANNCLNIPIADYGYVTIQVLTPYTFCMQTFVGVNAPARMFIRVLAEGTWSPWVEK